MCSDLMVRGVRFEAQAGQYNSQGTCPTTFISIVLTNHKIGRANGHAVLPFYLLNFNFFVTCNHNHACYCSGQGNFLITKGPILVYKFCRACSMAFSSNVVEFSISWKSFYFNFF